MSRKGILLALSSLPGKYATGDFGEEAFKFIKILEQHKINIWQILPLNPIGYGHSPYQPFSSYVFDEIYISIEDLQKRGLIGRVNKVPSRSKADYEWSKWIKGNAIIEAYDNFKKDSKNLNKLNKFLSENKYVEEYAEFISLKELNNGATWNEWSVGKEDKKEEYELLFARHAFAQYILFEEWNKIRKYAIKHNIKIVGDVPFYVGYDSSDVYFHKESFMLDEKYNPTCIAGVPPDYFTEFGQRWGNPIWNWDYLYKTDFKTMMDRIYFASKFYDIIRIDHFRAFDSYWAINPECETAVDGKWCYPDGYKFFNRLIEKYPDIELIVEDLGDLRPEVLELRDHFNFPGIRELEFTIFDDEINNKRIEKENMVYYTSTHDNETLNQWLHNLKMEDKMKLVDRMNELNVKGYSLLEKLIHYTLSRKENTIIIPASDILALNKNHRMNVPGIVDEFNWKFKLKDLSKLSRALYKYFD